MEAKLDIVDKCCGKEMQQIGGMSHDRTVNDEVAYLCFVCGKMISMKIEILDEEVLESYKETYQEECTNCSQENQETGFSESWDGACPDCGRIIPKEEATEASSRKKKFILGYRFSEDELTTFSSEQEADFEAEEWVIVEAQTIEEAKEKYDETFLAWKKKFDGR